MRVAYNGARVARVCVCAVNVVVRVVCVVRPQ